LARLISSAYKRYDFVSAFVIGPQGMGKTTYAMLVAYEVYGDWGQGAREPILRPQRGAAEAQVGHEERWADASCLPTWAAIRICEASHEEWQSLQVRGGRRVPGVWKTLHPSQRPSGWGAMILAFLAENQVNGCEVLRRVWCGGWDLNPRRPTPAGPGPAPFDLARAPPHPRLSLGAPRGYSVAPPGGFIKV